MTTRRDLLMQAAAAGMAVATDAPAPGNNDAQRINSWLANGGGTLQPGTYNIASTLNVPTGAMLLGAGTTLNKTFGGTLVQCETGTRVADVKMLCNGSGSAVVPVGSHVRLTRLWIESSGDRSVYVNGVGGDFLTVEGCVITGSGMDGIVVHGRQQVADSVRCPRIVDNVVLYGNQTGTHIGIECWGGVWGAIVSRNYVCGSTGGMGISLDMTRGAVVSDNVVEHQTCELMVGIELADAEGCRVSSNEIYGVCNPGSGGIARAISITNGPSGGSTGHDNVIVGNHVNQASNGLFAGNDSKALNIVGNTFVDCLTGIYLEGGSEHSGNADNALIQTNQFRLKAPRGAPFAAIKLRYVDKAQVQNNRIGAGAWIAAIVLDASHGNTFSGNISESAPLIASWDGSDYA